MTAHDLQTVDGGHCGQRHGGLAGDQTKRLLRRLDELPAVVCPPPGHGGAAHDGKVADFEGNAVAGFQFQPGGFGSGSLQKLRRFQKMKAKAEHRLPFRTVAQSLPEKTVFGVVGGRLCGNEQNHAELFCQNIALVGAIGQTADVRAGEDLVIALFDAQKISRSRQHKICADGLVHKPRRKGQPIADAVVIQGFQHGEPPFNTSELSYGGT